MAKSQVHSINPSPFIPTDCGNEYLTKSDPALSNLHISWQTLFSAATPYLMYGALSLFAAGSIVLLPETLNQPLPDTIADIDSHKGETRYRKLKNGVEV